jgi:Ca2+-binding RTX toxin-like protein
MRTTRTSAPHRRQRRSAVAKAALLAVAVGTAAVAVVGLPTAGAAVTVGAAVPAAVTVGAPTQFPVTLTGTAAPDVVSQINVLPACGAVPTEVAALGCTAPEPGVFEVGVAPGGTCVGTTSVGAALPNGVVPITLNPPEGIGIGNCTVLVSLNPLAEPATDVDAAPGTQTYADVSAVANGVNQYTGASIVTVNPAPVPPGPTCGGQEATVVRGSTNDVVEGTPGNDVVILGSGNDSFVGNGGNDIVCAGSGNDVVDLTDSGAGDTTYVDAGSGNDTIDSGDSDDTVLGGSGNDVINHGGGTDTITPGSGLNAVNP